MLAETESAAWERARSIREAVAHDIQVAAA
jgi:hypothetical protein